MVIKKSSKTKDKVVQKNTTKIKKTVENKRGAKIISQDSTRTCKVRMLTSKVLSILIQHRKRIIHSILVALAFIVVFGSIPMYCYTTKTIAERYENSVGYRRAIFGWLKVVMSRKPNEKIKLEGENLDAYNAIKKYAVKIANIYPSLRNLQIKASILTPVDSEGTIITYKSIIERAGKYEWCPICKDLIINKSEKENYRYYFEIAKLYEKMGDRKQAQKYINISIEKFKKDENLSSNKKLSRLLETKQVEIEKMSMNTNKKEKANGKGNKTKIKAVVKKAVTKEDKSKSKK